MYHLGGLFMIKHFSFLIVLLLTGSLFAGSIFVADYEYQADVCVFVTDYEYQADASVWICDYAYESSDDDCIWYICEHEYQSDVVVYYVDYEYQADLKVYFCEYEYQAEWEESNPWRGRLH